MAEWSPSGDGSTKDWGLGCRTWEKHQEASYYPFPRHRNDTKGDPLVRGGASGLWFDIPAAHWEKCSRKTQSSAPKLDVSSPTLSGPRGTQHHFLARMTTNVLMYGAMLWDAAQLGAVFWHTLSTSLHSSTLPKACGYSTVGALTAHVLGKTTPTPNVLTRERAAVAKALSNIPTPSPASSINMFILKHQSKSCQKSTCKVPVKVDLLSKSCWILAHLSKVCHNRPLSKFQSKLICCQSPVAF